MALKIDKNLTIHQHDEIISFLKDWFEVKFPKAYAVLGISGGKDSTICAGLLAKAIGPERVIGVLMPNGEQKDIRDSIEVCNLLKIRNMIVNIGPLYETLKGHIDMTPIEDSPVDWTPLFTTNEPARLRMTVLYGIAAQVGGFVINTCNMSEDYIGYSTKYGDAAGDISILNKLTVSEVLALGDYIGLPEHLVHKAPADGMCGKTDEDNLGFTYDQLDAYILGRYDCDCPNEVVEKIKKMHNNPNTKYKCIQMPGPLPDYKDAFRR